MTRKYPPKVLTASMHLRLTDKQKQLIKFHGGSKFIRDLIDAYVANQNVVEVHNDDK